MSDNFDYLVTQQDENVLKNLSQMAEKLRELKLKELQLETEYNSAKKEYEYYSSTVLPVAMHSAGVDELKLASGGMIKVKRNFYCSPNKNAEDRAIQAQWLEKHGGDYLIKEAAKVQDIDALKAAGIQYTEEFNINTTSLKSFLKDLLGINGGTASMQLDDIPASFHFQEVVSTEIEI